MQTKIFSWTLFTRWDDHHGFLNDVRVTLIDKTQASDHTKREYFWMTTLKTYYPYGLNIGETY